MAKVIDKQNIVKTSSSGGTDIQGTLLYAEVTTTALQIQTLGSVGKDLIAAPVVGTYIDPVKIIHEFTDNGTPWTFTAGDKLVTQLDSFYDTRDIAGLTSGVDSVYILNGLNGAILDVPNTEMAGLPFTMPSQALRLISTNDPLNVPFGNGTIKSKIWYYLKTFG